LKDQDRHHSIAAEIKAHHTTADLPVSVAMRRYANTVGRHQDQYLAERVQDVQDIESVCSPAIGQNMRIWRI